MQPVILRAAVLLATLSAGSICVAAEAGAGKKTFTFRIEDRVTIRSNPTTQIAISVKEWPGQTFLLWMPEDVRPLWNQWTPAVAPQNFSKTERYSCVACSISPFRARRPAFLISRSIEEVIAAIHSQSRAPGLMR